MENYPSYSYPDSGDSSPRSREIDFENPPPSWEDPPTQQTNSTSKVKIMVSYGGKIQPRTHDNLLSYVGGETKILAVDRNTKFSTLFSKLSCTLNSDSTAGGSTNSNSNENGSGFTFKYQLPGEDLDALISVTNDDDLENMMHEYDRLCRGSSKPARLRVFLFPVQKSSSFGSTSSDKIDRESDRFVEALNSGPPPTQPQVNSNVDFLFGLEKPPVQVPIPVQIPVQRHEPDPQIDARIQELNRMQISIQEMNRPKSEDGSMFTGAPANIPVGYWQQQQQQQLQPQQQQQPQQVSIEQHQQPPQQQPQPQALPPQFQQQFQHHHQIQQPHHQIQQPPQQHAQQVYMVHHGPPQGNMYHTPMIRPVTNQPQQAQPQPPQGYYQMQRVGSDQVYREQPVYSVGPGKMGGGGGYSEGMGGVPVRPVASMGVENNVGYQQVAYDSGSGRQVYYAAQPGNGGVVTAPFQGVSGEIMRPVAPTTVADPKVVQK